MLIIESAMVISWFIAYFLYFCIYLELREKKTENTHCHEKTKGGLFYFKSDKLKCNAQTLTESLSEKKTTINDMLGNWQLGKPEYGLG